MKINKEDIIEAFSLVPFGGKEWMQGEDLVCPNCSKGGKFGVRFSKNSGAVHCFKCEYSENIFKFLKRINRKDLIIYDQEVFLDTKIKIENKEEIEPEPELPEVVLPKGYQRIYYSSYLNKRNFKSYQYDQFEVGFTNHFLEKRLHDYLIFVIKQNGRNVGWLARSKKSKEWHKENLEKSKLGLCQLKLRYINSTGTDFDKILGGLDEITENTHTVFAVEGLFDKTNLSNLLETEKDEGLKVIFTFGNKFSDQQIKLLRKTNVKTVYLIYDEGTVKQSKQYSMELSKYFEVFVCYINDPDIDPGNMNRKYLFELLLNAKNFLYFYTSNLSIKLKL